MTIISNDFIELLQNLSGDIVNSLQSLSPEVVWALQLVFCFGSILFLLRTFGKEGLFAYIVLAIIAANIQVIKVVDFSLYDDPIPLGTILFCTIFLCTDILTEYYGKEAAKKAVWLSFAAYLVFVILMIFTLGFQPLSTVDNILGFSWAIPKHGHIEGVFSQSLTLLTAGMIAYLVSQYHDIWIYNAIKWLTKGRYLWVRNNVSTLVSGLIDNTIFSVLAWVVLATDPVDNHTLIFTYILGTYLIRVVVAVLDTPFIYLAQYMLPKSEKRS